MDNYKFMRNGLARALIFRVWICAGVISVIGAGYIFWQIRNNAERRTTLGLHSLAISGARQVEAELEIIENRCYDVGRVISLFRPKPAELKKYINEQLQSSPEILGLGCGFAPEKVYTDYHFFAYYAKWSSKEISGVEYSDGSFDYTKRQWYVLPEKSGVGAWVSPYRSKVDNQFVTSFGAPIMLDKQFVGAVVADLDLRVLKRIASSVSFGAQSQVFILDRKSRRFVYFTDWSVVEKGVTAEELIRDSSASVNDPLAKVLLEGGNGERQVEGFGELGNSIVSFQPLKKGDWTIGVIYPQREIYGAIDELLTHSAAIALLGFILLGYIMARVTSQIVAPLKELEKAAADIAGGNLVVRLPVINDVNEVKSLAESIGKMSEGLRSLVSQVKSSIVRQVSTSTQIAAATASQDESIDGFEKEVSQAAAAVAEISASARELSNTMNLVHHSAQEAGDSAGLGHQDLRELEKTMRNLTNATMSMAGKLEAVRQSAEEVGGVVKTIADVAEQTNLLSLNASVEAEKAGEYGRGFSVVAREIRRLSDKTAVATLDIAQMVESMRSAVDSGVTELEVFSETVNDCAATANGVASTLGGVIRGVEGLGPKFEQVNEGMKAQSLGAGEITEAMVRLRERARAASESMTQLNDATEQLREAAGLLRNEVSTFRTE